MGRNARRRKENKLQLKRQGKVEEMVRMVNFETMDRGNELNKPDWKLRFLKSYNLSPDDWLWCLHCERFFQAKDLRGHGRDWGECAFEDCGGAGIGMDLVKWDDYPEQNPHLWERWPKSTSDLTKGMRCSIK